MRTVWPLAGALRDATKYARTVVSLPAPPPRAPPMAIPITERANPLSMAIDVASPPEILAILNSIDLQIFNGWSEVRPRASPPTPAA